MAGLAMTKIRAFIAGVVAVVLLVVFAAFTARVLGWHVPILTAITDRFGF